MRRSGVRASPGANIVSRNVCLVRYLCVPLILYQLHWHSRLARRTYQSVQTDMRRSGVRASLGGNILAAMFALLDIGVFRYCLPAPVTQSVSESYLKVCTDREMRRSGVRASPGANILAAMFALLDICVFR